MLCFLCPWSSIFEALQNLSGFHHFLCVWDNVWSDLRSVHCTKIFTLVLKLFFYKSNVFNIVFDATIIQPMNLPIYVQHPQKYKSFIIKVWNGTISKINKVASFQKTLRNPWFWNTLFYTVKNLQVWKANFAIKPFHKYIK